MIIKHTINLTHYTTKVVVGRKEEPLTYVQVPKPSDFPPFALPFDPASSLPPAAFALPFPADLESFPITAHTHTRHDKTPKKIRQIKRRIHQIHTPFDLRIAKLTIFSHYFICRLHQFIKY